MSMSLTKFTIEPRHCALRYRHGVLEQVLPAGRHRRLRGQRLVVLDLRERLLQLAPQEVLTSDGVSVRVSAVVRWSVGDPVEFVEVSADPAATVYLAAQVALRDALATLTADEVVGRGAALPAARITAATAEVARRVGAEVAEVVVKDVIVPVELRAAAAELATARRRGEAQLEA
ncbi:MAG: slipin family protein, partial [Dermatophilaceae bacterium]|nr:slipin family protein [Dermatophilaceae bacterium]